MHGTRVLPKQLLFQDTEIINCMYQHCLQDLEFLVYSLISPLFNLIAVSPSKINKSLPQSSDGETEVARIVDLFDQDEIDN